MTSTARANLTGTDIVSFIADVTDSLETLAPMLDDLNALQGADFDAGTNAFRTVTTVTRLLAEADIDRSHAATVLTACALYARTGAVGHVGMLIALVLDALADNVSASAIRPIDLRAFLSSLPETIKSGFSHPAKELIAMAEASRTVAEKTADPIDSARVLIGEASMESQSALIDMTVGWVNPGAAVLTVMLAALHSQYEDNAHALEVVAQMLRDLSMTATRKPLEANEPVPGAEFSVDFRVDYAVEDHADFLALLNDRGARYSVSGTTDLLGMGSWRFHIDTSAPTSVLPGRGWVRNCVIKDARYGELIGHDELAVQQESSGVLYLSRPTWQRPDTVRVIALLRDTYFLHEVASTGAHVVLNPGTQDAVLIGELMRSAPAGVSLVLPADEEALRVGERARALVEENDSVTVVWGKEPFSDAAVNVCAAECAPIFMPSVGERTAAVTADILRSNTDRAKRRVVTISELGDSLYDQLVQLIGYGLERVIVFASESAQPAIVDTVTHALDVRQSGVSVETVIGEPAQVVLING
ncbi:MAG: hypothetical protein Q4P05_05555 [Actinomycetaceae bacterium]|nr:hypothetical protein [Actinomycetaceae bacterium]